MVSLLLSRLGPAEPHILYLIAHGLATVGFVVLALLLVVLGWRNWQARLFAFAALTQALWSASVALLPAGHGLSSLLTTCSAAAWSIFFASMFPHRGRGLPLFGMIGSGLLVVAKLALGFVLVLPLADGIRLALTIDLLAIILALSLSVGVFHAAGESKRWALKFICFPLTAAFGYALFLLSQALAWGIPASAYFNLGAVLWAAAVPLIGIGIQRRGFWRGEVVVSRQAALYSISLIGIGAYLVTVSVLAILLDPGAERTAVPVQEGLLIAALMLIGFLLSSGSARARVKAFVGRHVYARRYDYAEEWRKFMHTLSEEGEASPLETRIIRACADLLEVPGGALWTVEGGRLQPTATWHYRIPSARPGAIDPELFRDVKDDWACLSGKRLRASPFGADPAAWLAIPLPHGADMIGVIILRHPRVPHEIDQQDEDLLMLIARQCSSFLAENKAAQSLEENKQFARFNRQYAFVAHDIKNIVSQLSVMVRNFDRHFDKPEFRDDIQSTINHSVTRLQHLLGRLARFEAGDMTPELPQTFCLHDAVSRALRDRGPAADQTIRFHAEEPARAAMIRASEERFDVVFGHLLANACEANGPDGSVQVHLELTGRHAILDITDEGPGMSFEFVRDSLFQPFRTTKATGYGVGAFQCREFAREQGGDLEVISSPGSGTTMRLRLPVLSQAHWEAAS